ncbi:head GIN domain-containing protein [Mucilaginibacter sp. KACC 22063]|uniref:head GIN domain-containing protein n=1 Tax=Mucilaginibacter sp. KACC 22063 TaxID=3025666 RepID=UPI0023658848|nr:head GIN domain-containing protein [Mucilaginibacter sp. KACC 22063]WDF54907.1 DUF2807 domain-containing protein [Mucilaginibacter sp. KACC 22063]
MKSLTTILFAFLFITGINTAFADSQVRSITGFNGVTLSCSADVYITQGNTESVRVEAPSNVINRIKTEVKDGVLNIYSKGDWDWNLGDLFGGHKKIAVYISAKQLNSLTVSGSGDMSFKDGITTNSLRLRVSGSGDMTGRLQTKDLECTVTGSGDMKLSGRAETSAVRISGSGDFSGRDLVTSITRVHITGSGDATVNANNTVDASVTGSGDIRYTGSAKNVSSSATGSGSVHKI